MVVKWCVVREAIDGGDTLGSDDEGLVAELGGVGLGEALPGHVPDLDNITGISRSLRVERHSSQVSLTS